MASVDFVECHDCKKAVPSNQSVRCAAKAGAVKCTGCAHSGDVVPSVDPVDYAAQLTAVPWTPPFVDCLGLVQFDLQLGQVVEYLYPPAPFSQQQETELAFLCFPDANHMGDGDTFHDFVFSYNASEFDQSRNRPRRTGVPTPNSSPAPVPVPLRGSRRTSAASGVPDSTCTSDNDAPDPLDESPSPASSPSPVAGSPSSRASPAGTSTSQRRAFDSTVVERFCSTMFRQRKDATIARGHQQKAIFVMSAYPFPALLHGVLRAVVGLFDTTTDFDPVALLEMVWRELSLWPRPLPCREYPSLPLLGEVLAYTTPQYDPIDIVQPIWSTPAPQSELTAQELSAVDRIRLVVERLTVCPDQLCDSIAYWESRHTNAPANDLSAWLTSAGWDSAARKFVARGFAAAADTGTGEGGRSLTEEELDTLRRILRSASFDATWASALDERESKQDTSTEDSSLTLRAPSETLLGRFRHTHEYTAAICDLQNDSLRRSVRAAHRALGLMQLANGDRTVAPGAVRHVFAELNCHAALFPHMSKAWKLWELMITGAPIAFLGPSAPAVTAMALSVSALVAPLPWVGLLRPYVTINNREIDQGIDRHPAGATIVGATNPFFVRHLEHWPHMVCVSHDMKEATTHKTWPANSDKRAKQQFKLKNRMFCSRHYLVKTDKDWGNGVLTQAPNVAANFVDERFSPAAVGAAGTPTTPSAVVFKTFHDLTKEFVAPLELFVAVVMRKHQPYFTKEPALRRLLSHRAALEFLQELTPPPKSFQRFKTAKEAAEVYEGFLLSALGQRWLQTAVRMHYRRFLVEDVRTLDDVVRLCSSVAERYDALSLLQAYLDRTLRQAVLDVPVVQRLVQLSHEIIPLRDALVGRPNTS